MVTLQRTVTRYQQVFYSITSMRHREVNSHRIHQLRPHVSHKQSTHFEPNVMQQEQQQKTTNSAQTELMNMYQNQQTAETSTEHQQQTTRSCSDRPQYA